jgi:hypothetical protein
MWEGLIVRFKMKNEIWGLRVDICPGDTRIPIVSHIFYGASEQHVRNSLAGHIDDDKFLRACYESGFYGGHEYKVIEKIDRREL